MFINCLLNFTDEVEDTLKNEKVVGKVSFSKLWNPAWIKSATLPWQQPLQWPRPQQPQTCLMLPLPVRIYLFFITNFRFRFFALACITQNFQRCHLTKFFENINNKLTLCFDMKNGASSLTSGFENQLSASAQFGLGLSSLKHAERFLFRFVFWTRDCFPTFVTDINSNFTTISGHFFAIYLRKHLSEN